MRAVAREKKRENMFDKKARQAAVDSFRKANSSLVEKAEAKGIDWEALLAKFGPLVKAILAILLK